MEEACRLIIKKAIDNNISTKKELEKLKIQTCRELNLPGFMSNSKILQFANSQELELLRPILMKKPSRTISASGFSFDCSAVISDLDTFNSK